MTCSTCAIGRWALLALLVQAGCAGVEEPVPPADDDADPSPESDDDDHHATWDGTPILVSDLDANLELSEFVPTVATVEWTASNLDVQGTFLQIGPTAAYGRVLGGEEVEDGVYRATVLGLKASTTYYWRVVALTHDGPVATANAFFVTGGLPSGLPTLSLTEVDDELASGGYVVTSFIGVPSTTVILDEDGDFVWWYRHDEGDRKVVRARISRDGEWMLLLVEAPAPGDIGFESELVRVRLDGAEVQVQPLVDVHQDFVETSDGNLVFLSYEVWDVDGEEILGDGLVEVGPDGDASAIWSAWEHAAYDPALHEMPGDSWSHANALQLDEETGLVLVSFRNLDSIFAVDREDGEVRWRIGGEHSDFKLESGETGVFHEQHQFQVLADGLLVFDNGTPEQAASRVVELALGDGSELVSESWSFSADPPLYVYALGDVHRHPDGNTLVTWSTSGQMDLVSPDGDVVWRLNTSLGWAFAYTTWREQLGNESGL